MKKRIVKNYLHNLVSYSNISVNQYYFFFFFFSSRRRHTRCSRDWSSDVCSSDLPSIRGVAGGDSGLDCGAHSQERARRRGQARSEERRVGKECRSRWWPYHFK